MSPIETGSMLADFFATCKKRDGGEYLPDSIYQLYNALHHHYFNLNGWDLWSGQDFDSSRHSLDRRMKVLTHDGIGSDKEKQEVFTNEEEIKIYSVFNVTSAWNLLYACFYVCGKFFALRGYQDHRALSWGELRKYVDRTGDVYYGRKIIKGKNFQGGIADRKKRQFAKLIRRMYRDDRNPSYDLVTYLDELRAHSPSSAEFVYLTPIENPTTHIWFKVEPLSDTLLRSLMHRICSLAGIPPRSNHILRGQCATQLFEAGFKAQQVMERTGHQSLKAVMAYNQTSDATHKRVCDALAPKQEAEPAVKRPRSAPALEAPVQYSVPPAPLAIDSVSSVPSAPPAPAPALYVPPVPPVPPVPSVSPLSIDVSGVEAALRGILQNCTLQNPTFNIYFQMPERK